MAAAEAEPDRFGGLLADMDRTGRVNGVFKRLRVAQQAAAIRVEPPPLPGRGPYRVIVADPPWPYDVDTPDPRDRATYPYPQMSLAEIAALDVGSIAAPEFDRVALDARISTCSTARAKSWTHGASSRSRS